MEMKHFSHEHPLKLLERTCEDISFRCCDHKSTYSSDDDNQVVYGCEECNYFIHQACSEIPHEIQHFYHPHHLLKLCVLQQTENEVECVACYKTCNNCLIYRCAECPDFNMGIACALLPDKLKQDGCCVDHMEDFSHGHPLLLCDSGEEICKACKEPCADPTYGCKRCKIFIHKSCTGLPLQIIHPLHPPHLLTLTLIPEKSNFDPISIFCDGCITPADGFLAYKCGECSFLLDVDCGGRNPVITCEHHNHIITLITHKPDYSECVVCMSLIPYGSSFFTCRHCTYYKLHLLCGPLPCTIKDKCHIDPLKLMEPFVEDYNETDEVYCDTCEQLRDPNEPVYYCKECNFITEIKCVMPEVLRLLEGHNGNVKLKTAKKTRIQHIGRVFSARCENIIEEDDTETQIKDLEEKYFEVKLDLYYNGLNFFTIGECVEILKIFQEAGLLSKGKHLTESDIISLYPNDAFRNLMLKCDPFYGDDPDLIRMLDDEGVIVRIGDLMIMQHLASVLKGLLHAHGDFTANSTLEPRLKMFFLNLLCNVVHNMRIHYVKEVEETNLEIWRKAIQTVKHVGFEIQFLIERLSDIALALFGRQVRETFAKTKSQIEKSFDEVKKLEAKLDAKKRELEALKLDLVLQKKAMEYERTPEMKKCLERESELKWKKAWEDYLLP